METLQTNPCAGCTIGQDCCNHLSGLRLTQIEFDRCFQQHADEIVVEREGPLFVVSQRDGGVCPNWQSGGCSVYDGGHASVLCSHTRSMCNSGETRSPCVSTPTRVVR